MPVGRGMKQEIKDIALQAAASSPTSLYAIFSKVTLAEWIAIALGVLQALYLLRKWWREESEWGLKLRAWARRQPAATELAVLDE